MSAARTASAAKLTRSEFQSERRRPVFAPAANAPPQIHDGALVGEGDSFGRFAALDRIGALLGEELPATVKVPAGLAHMLAPSAALPGRRAAGSRNHSPVDGSPCQSLTFLVNRRFPTRTSITETRPGWGGLATRCWRVAKAGSRGRFLKRSAPGGSNPGAKMLRQCDLISRAVDERKHGRPRLAECAKSMLCRRGPSAPPQSLGLGRQAVRGAGAARL